MKKIVIEHVGKYQLFSELFINGKIANFYTDDEQDFFEKLIAYITDYTKYFHRFDEGV